MKVFYATANAGKADEVTAFLAPDVEVVVRLAEVKGEDVPETGQTLEENALAKARHWAAKYPEEIIMADDTGLEIDALGGEPGVHVRRWKDGETRMNDEEIIAYTLERLSGLPPAKRGARFRTVIALVNPDGQEHTVDGTLRGRILEEPTDQRIDGFPFRSLMYVEEWQTMLGDEPPGQLTHRQQAVQKAKEILAGL